MIRVRPARPDEVDLLAGIGLAAWKQGIGPLVPVAVVRRVESDNPFVPFLRERGAAVLVAVLAELPVGLGATDGDGNTISDIWVAPAHEGKGAGTALVTALEAILRDKGFAEVCIQAAAGNARALALYRHLGFVEQGRRVEFDSILGVDLEKVELKKPL